MTRASTRQRWIGHADLDAFYASVEQRDHPEYRDRPVVVGALPGHRGVVAAANYAARVFGIHSAMPIAEAYRRCPDAVYLRPDMARYARVSKRVFQVLATISPVVEPVSVDEAYLDLTGLESILGTPQEVGRAIKQRVLERTGLTVSVGIGPNRLIAKLASDYRKPDGLTVVYPDRVDDFLAPMPVANLRGLGKQTQKKFSPLGIETVAQLRGMPLATLEKHLGKRAAHSFRNQALGIASTEVTSARGRKSISKETTFESDTEDSEYLHDVLNGLATEVAAKTRRENLAGLVVTLKVRFSGYETYTRQHKLSSATDDERVILQQAWRLFVQGDLPHKPVRLIGVGISDWQQQSAPIQEDLFDQVSKQQLDKRLLKTIDLATDRFGKGALQLGLSRQNNKLKSR